MAMLTYITRRLIQGVVVLLAVSGGMAELHHLLNHIIPKMSRVVQSETFVFMKSRCKWTCLPKGLKDW